MAGDKRAEFMIYDLRAYRAVCFSSRPRIATIQEITFGKHVNSFCSSFVNRQSQMASRFFAGKLDAGRAEN
jgi:hypothetical protein